MSTTQKKLAQKITVKPIAKRGTPKKNIGGACLCS